MITPSLPAVCGLKYGVSGGSLYPRTSGSFLVSAEAFLKWRKRRTLGFPREDQPIGRGWRRRPPGVSQRISAGIGAGGEKAVGKLPRHVAKTWGAAPAMPPDLPRFAEH